MLSRRLFAVRGGRCLLRAVHAAVFATLVSHAKLGTHFEHGGLLLRGDIHRLFDDGVLAVNPDSLRIDVGPTLAAYPQYARLHDLPMEVRIRSEHEVWLGQHWEEHRGRRLV